MQNALGSWGQHLLLLPFMPLFQPGSNYISERGTLRADIVEFKPSVQRKVLIQELAMQYGLHNHLGVVK